MEKKTLGRQRVEMKKITNETHLIVSFSKRKAGLFKKASEISTLCGAELAIVVFSPSKKPFSFGNPTVDTVVDRYLNCSPPDTSETSLLIKARQNANIRQLNNEITRATDKLEAAKELGEQLKVMINENQHPKIQALDLSQLLELKSALERLKKDVEEEEQKLAVLNADSQQFYFGNSSGQGVMAFDVNMIGGRFVVPNSIVPTPGYSLNPSEGYNVNPAEQFNVIPVNPTEEDDIDPVEEYIVDPSEVNHVWSALEYNDNPAEGYDINPVDNMAAPHGSGGIHNNNLPGNDTAGIPGSGGGCNSNPPNNDVLDPLDLFFQELEKDFSNI
ncbi:hypothetical protein F3Y22_tig00110893pilonHSYRG00416 [Hibiscus syriacus]|uniref:MADS-box domain-containing protein n=1 Tax=Hibiscus syriacus TaxID=106335 RepID=A0A6A2ZHA6_HIBSY|nr:hypothetical protein F3Y22_tig00110893pilonHSYRG00416 [Hibiscus syriacus]